MDSQQQQPVKDEKSLPALSISAKEKLSEDYREISSLMAECNELVATFTSNMGSVVDEASKQAQLAALWEEQTRDLNEVETIVSEEQAKLPARTNQRKQSTEMSKAAANDEGTEEEDRILFL
jgi:hypothetical protein